VEVLRDRSGDQFSGECRVPGRTNRIAAVSIACRIEAKLRRKGKSRLEGLDAADAPAADKFIGYAAAVSKKRLSFSEWQIVGGIDCRHMPHIGVRRTPIEFRVFWIHYKSWGVGPHAAVPGGAV